MMDRKTLESLCGDMTPEDVHQHLLELQEALEKFAWGYAEDGMAVAAAARVVEAALPAKPTTVYVATCVYDGVLDELEVYTDEASAATRAETWAKEAEGHADIY